MSTTIQWTDETWNPTTGCTKVSEGCRHCYAERVLPRTNQPFNEIVLHPDRLDHPLHWKKPRRVFVNSLSDLFHEDIPTEFIDRVFAVMALAHQHTYQILTKRPARMREYCSHLSERCVEVSLAITRTSWWDGGKSSPCGVGYIEEAIEKGPLPNVWLGVSVEDQATADERILVLLQTPAAVRFISAEPLLGPINLNPPASDAYKMLSRWYGPEGFDEKGSQPEKDRMGGYFPKIDWAIIGGESGPGARPCDLAWIRSLKDQCQAAGVPPFVKQLGANPVGDFEVGKPWTIQAHGLNDKKGGDLAEWPEDLRVREYPKQ